MTLSVQFLTMLSMIGMGSLFGASLDTYQRFLKRPVRKSWVVFINDILFWLLQGLAIFYILFLVNEGELRFYIFLALLCGFAAYQALMKNIYLKLLEIVISTIISIYYFIVKVIRLLVIRPVQFFFTTLIGLLVLVGKLLLLLIKWTSNVLMFILKVLLSPVRWIFRLLIRILPAPFKKSVDKFYDKLKGYFQKGKEYVKKLAEKWKKKD
ncbi:spore cortex biosynthesis protein YabQ [Cytobacillus kochii]|uniref:spore cortex biosynthesis protein YabQ n=1 Tax=Cytobacillus TaxID=2675230 RepID=UPI0027809D9D|nr:spore cortex biosynthesis protein YabQ [Cytobacillus kochii]MDQ0187969.1 spore cortex biosynthesis protein YabQ [Cytobacillus kochii]